MPVNINMNIIDTDENSVFLFQPMTLFDMPGVSDLTMIHREMYFFI